MLEYTEGDPIADTKAPAVPLEDRWDRRQFEAKLVNPANRRKHRVIVVGTGLAGGSAGATLAEQGYHVVQFCFQDSPRRAHSVAAQGGINAAKNYRNDGDSRVPAVLRHRQGRRLPVPRVQCVPAGRGVRRRSSTRPSPRACRSPASTAACWTPGRSAACRCSARSTPAARRASNCCSARTRRCPARSTPATSRLHARTEMLDLIVVDGRARGIVARDLSPARSARTSRTRSCSPPAATATCSTCRPTPRAPTPARSGGRTGAAPTSPTRASPRSTRRASRDRATTSRS